MSPTKVSSRELITAPCRVACPAGVDAARYIRMLLLGKPEQALAVVRERIPFPTVCADACFAPCEEACAYRQFGDAISIRALKRAAVDQATADDWKSNRKKANKTNKKVAIIGAGPAGLTAAYYLSGLGHDVDLYDAFSEPGGTMRYGIPDFRLPKSRLDEDIQVILDQGVTFKGGVEVGRDVTFDELKNKFDAIFIACGATANVNIPLEGSDKTNVLSGWDLLTQVNSGQDVSLCGEVLVIGGGNVAVDAARTAKRLGADNVTIVYRRTKAEMPAHPSEITAAEEEGIVILDSWAPKKVTGNGKAAGLGMIHCHTDASCDYQPVYDEEITHRLKADFVILAIGQQPDLSFLKGDKAFDDRAKTLAVNEDLMTGHEGVFAGGDAVSGPDSIIGAIAHGRKAAQAIDKYLGGQGDITEVLADPEQEIELSDLPAEPQCRQAIPHLKPWKRISGFEQAETGYTPEQARTEAGRCLACDARQFDVVVVPEHCKECGYCAEVCKMDVFGPSDTFNARGYRPMECKASDRCVGCLKCFYSCPDFAIDVKVRQA